MKGALPRHRLTSEQLHSLPGLPSGIYEICDEQGRVHETLAVCLLDQKSSEGATADHV